MFPKVEYFPEIKKNIFIRKNFIARKRKNSSEIWIYRYKIPITIFSVYAIRQPIIHVTTSDSISIATNDNLSTTSYNRHILVLNYKAFAKMVFHHIVIMGTLYIDNYYLYSDIYNIF